MKRMPSLFWEEADILTSKVPGPLRTESFNNWDPVLASPQQPCCREMNPPVCSQLAGWVTGCEPEIHPGGVVL